MNFLVDVCEKKFVFKFASMKNEFFFSHRASADAGVKRGARLGAWLYTSKRIRSYVHKC